VAVTGGLLALVLGLTRAGADGWGSAGALVPLAVGIGLLGLFLAVERRAAAPLVPLGVLAIRPVRWGLVAGLLAFATETSLVFLLTLYLQDVLGFSPLGAGASFAVLGVGTVVGGALGPRVIARVGAARAIGGGFAAQALATAPLVALGADPTWLVVVLVATFVGGVANLVAIVGYMVATTSAVPDEQQGLATGLASMSQQVGITLGTPVLSAIVTARAGAGGPDALLGGVSTAIAVNAAACAAVAVVALAA
ncbi:MFS transporter, partial [Patulibacter sp. S7RM1-6]